MTGTCAEQVSQSEEFSCCLNTTDDIIFRPASRSNESTSSDITGIPIQDKASYEGEATRQISSRVACPVMKQYAGEVTEHGRIGPADRQMDGVVSDVQAAAEFLALGQLLGTSTRHGAGVRHGI